MLSLLLGQGVYAYKRRVVIRHNKKLIRSEFVVFNAYIDSNNIELSSYITIRNLQIPVLTENGAMVYNQFVFLPEGTTYQFTIPFVEGKYKIVLMDSENEYDGDFYLSK